MSAGSNLEQVSIDSPAALRAWLELHHAQSSSVWLVVWKKGDVRYIPHDNIVEELLAFGWVDSLPRKLDVTRSMLLASPRKSGSAWSAKNKARVEKLEREGRLSVAGGAAVRRAKADGSWSKLDRVEALTAPKDLVAALDEHQDARKNWDGFPRSVKRGLLEWIEQAKHEETRQRRMQEIASEAAVGRRAHQFRQAKGRV